jgi:cysteine desulfuration protein SufE
MLYLSIMNSLDTFLNQPQHASLVEEYHVLEGAEDKLTWLMERTPMHVAVPVSECTPERRVPGCLSGLWLSAQMRDNNYFFACASESEVVQGIGSLLCDLYSQRSASEILRIGSAFATELRLDGLLTLTRRRAVSSIVGFILHSASGRDSGRDSDVLSAPDRAA